MRQKDIVNLIRYHCEKDEESFIAQAKKIASEFYDQGDEELAKYINSLLLPVSTIVPQNIEKKTIGFLDQVYFTNEPYYLPDAIHKGLRGIINACKRNIGINKFLFYGKPGTGKTQAATQISRILKRNLWQVNTSKLINSYLGETSKNIASLFKDITDYPFKKTMVILFDEIDSLSLKRNDARDLREMDRATTELFKGLDSLPNDVVLIATTNLFDDLDPALSRRFAAKIDFDSYQKEDLIQIGLHYYDICCKRVGIDSSYRRTVLKLLSFADKLPSPGELKNVMMSSTAFSDPNNIGDHVALIYEGLGNSKDRNIETIREQYNFTLRELELISGVSKSEIGRRLKKL